MRQAFGVLLLFSFIFAVSGCGNDKPSPSKVPSGIMATPKDGPQPATGGGPPAGGKGVAPKSGAAD
jgi:hypothetical protein